MDHTPYLCSVPALQFYQKLGGYKALLEHTKPLLDWAQQMLCHAFNTPVLPIPPGMQAPNMRVLRLPEISQYSPPSRDLVEQFKDEVYSSEPSLAYVQIQAFGGYYWLRISANVY